MKFNSASSLGRQIYKLLTAIYRQLLSPCNDSSICLYFLSLIKKFQHEIANYLHKKMRTLV